MSFTYPEELLLSGIDQFLLYGRRNAFSYSANVTLADGTETKFSNYIFPRNCHAGRYLGELIGAGDAHFTTDNMNPELIGVYPFLSEGFFTKYRGELARVDAESTKLVSVSGVHLMYTDQTIVVFQLANRALMDVSGNYMPLGGARLN